MNLVTADIARANGDLWASFGEHRLRMTEKTLARHPGLDGFEGRPVVLGLRPEDMEDASLVPDAPEDRRLSIVCDIREDMGSEVYVHFNMAAEPVASEEVLEAHVVDEPEDAVTRAAAEEARGSGVRFVARLERETRAREREPLDVSFDVDLLHLFDPETGVCIGR